MIRGREGADPPPPSAATRPVPAWRIRGGHLALDRPLVMGILNLTPDSFSDGGELPDVEAAVRRAERLRAAGADLLDVGGESTRPGASEVEEDEELRRVIPVIERLADTSSVPLSVDTRKAGVARAALAAGASVVNDVSGLAHDREMGGTVAEMDAGVVLMHMRGTPQDMQARARYGNVVAEVAAELREAVGRAETVGIGRDHIVLDPGIGFAKTGPQSVQLLANLERIRALGFPVLVGPSRKSFLGELLGGLPPGERVVGTAAACVMAYLGGARIFRVHDVGPVVHALTVARAVQEARAGPVGGERNGGEARIAT